MLHAKNIIYENIILLLIKDMQFTKQITKRVVGADHKLVIGAAHKTVIGAEKCNQ